MRHFLAFIMLLAAATVARAFDFSTTAPTGQVLYFTATSATTAKVVSGDTKPSGRLTLPGTAQGYTINEIDQMAFSGCRSLTSVTVPGSVASIGMRAFAGCSALTSAFLQEGVQAIGMMAFSSCTSLDTVALPSSLTLIAAGALGNTGYSNNNDNWDNQALYVGHYLIAVESGREGRLAVAEGTEGIATNALDYCHISQASLPASLRFVGSTAFRDCMWLDTLHLQGDIPPAISGDSFLNAPEGMAVVVPCDALAAYRAAPYWGALHLVGDSCPDPSGIATGADAPFTASVAHGGLEINAPAGTRISVCDPGGRIVATAPASGCTQRIPLPGPGAYIVAVDGIAARKFLYLR